MSGKKLHKVTAFCSFVIHRNNDYSAGSGSPKQHVIRNIIFLIYFPGDCLYGRGCINQQISSTMNIQSIKKA